MVGNLRARAPVPGHGIHGIGFISLVPGGSLYRTMRYALARDWSMFGLQGMRTGLYAIAISAGVVLITALTEVVYKNLKTKKTS